MISALVLALGLSWTFSRNGIYPNVPRVMTAIKVSKLKMPQMDGYIERNQEMEAFKKMLYDPGPLKTIIVTGPRGSGKSTLVQHCLAGKAGAVRIFLDPRSDFSVEEFAENVMHKIGLPRTEPGTKAKGLLYLALEELCERQEELPIIVVEADHRCTPGQLRSLLILMKQYGADNKLIRPIVVLSSSKATFGLAISEKELRSHYFHVDDLTDKQCLEYIESRLSMIIEGDEQEKISNFVKEVVPHLGIGNRLIHLDSVLVGMSKQNLHKIQKHIEWCVEEEVLAYTNSMRSFFGEVKGTCHSKEAVKRALKLLLEKGSMPLHTFHRVCGIKDKRLIEIISNIDPHPFYVEPKHRTIHFHAIFQHKINFDILFDEL